MKRMVLYTIVILLASLQVSSQTTVTYTYDNLNRLKGVHFSNGVTVTYTYDALGNRTKKTVTSSSSQIIGDVNGDGLVDVFDVTQLIDIILQAEESSPAADLNQDGIVDIADVIILVDKVLNGT